MKKREKEDRGVRILTGPAGFLSFFLFFAAVAFLGGPAYPLAVGAALLVHEAGHAAAAAMTGARLEAVGIGAWGIRTVFDYSGVSPLREAAVLLSGPAANVAAAFIAARTKIPAYRGGMYFILACISLAAVNLRPVEGLDGGAALEALVSRFSLPDRASAVCSRVSTVFTVLFWIFSAAVQAIGGVNYSLLFLSAYFLLRSKEPA